MYLDPLLSASQWESLLASKGHSVFLKHRNQHVQMYVLKMNYCYMKEVEKRPVTCGGDHDSE